MKTVLIYFLIILASEGTAAYALSNENFSFLIGTAALVLCITGFFYFWRIVFGIASFITILKQILTRVIEWALQKITYIMERAFS